MEKKDKMTVRYGIVAYTLEGPKDKPSLSILHFCGYAKPPTQRDIDALAKELNTDPEFGLVGKIGKDVFLMEATDWMIREMARQIRENT